MTFATPRTNEQSLFDIKGLGKPSNVQWRICKIHRVAQEDHRVSDRCVRLSFSASDCVGGKSRQRYTKDEFEQHNLVRWVMNRRRCSGKSQQVRVALLALPASDGFDIVLGAPRCVPLSGGKRRALLRQILIPDWCKNSRCGRSWCADTKEVKRALDEAIRQLLLKPSSQASWNSILP